MDRNEVLTRLRDYRRGRGKRYPIVRIGVFGSAARDTLTDLSDVDVVVELEQPDMMALIGIKQDLEEVLHRRVDIVRYRQRMNPDLKQRIEAEAIYG